MSNLNVALVQSLYAVFRRGEIATIVGAVTPGAVWEFIGRRNDYPAFGTFKGPQGVREFFRIVADSQDVVSFTPRDFHASGDIVLVLGNYAWTIRKTGKPVDTDWVLIFTVKTAR